MKRFLALILSVLLALVTCFALASCDNGKKPTESTTDSKSESTEPNSTGSTTGESTSATTEPDSNTGTDESETGDSIPAPDSKLTISQAIELGKSMENNKYTEGKYYVTGTLKSVFNKNNGNIKIVDKDGNSINVYGTMNADGTVKFADMDQAPAVGDVVTVYGVIGQSNGSARIEGGWITEFTTPDSSDTDPDTSETVETSSDTETTDQSASTSPSDSESTEGTTTDDTTEADNQEETTEAPPPPRDDVIFNNGNVIDMAGINWEDGFFSTIKHSIDESKAQSISAADLLAKMQNRTGDDALKSGEVWIVTDALVLESDKSYYGNGAAVIAKGGIVIKNAVDVVLKDVVVKGKLNIENSSELVFYKLDITSDEVAVTITGNCSNVSFKTCRIYGNSAAVISSADFLTIYKTYVRANHALQLTGDNIIVQDCKIVASTGALTLAGDDCIARENTIMVLSSGFGITVSEGSKNALVALNDIQGAQKSITVSGGYNCSVILNRAIIVAGADCTNLYVVDNSLGGYLDLQNNNYLIADGNSYTMDGLSHAAIKVGNTNTNGDSITNVDHRVDVGANEKLLPHTNKELFVGMQRKTIVSDASFTSLKGLGSYIKECGTKDGIVIVPPGAYSTNGIVSFGKALANTTVYAYGVYQEYSEQNYDNYVSNQLNFADTNDINIYGLTVGYAIPSSGQVRVVEKYFKIDGDNTKYYSESELTDAQKEKARTYSMTIIPDAGYWDGFTKTDPDLFHQSWPEFFLLDENGEYLYQCDENVKGRHTVTKNSDGTMTFTLTASASDDDTGEYKGVQAIWARVTPGTVLTCRLANGNRLSVCVSNSQNITLRDVTVYGYSAAFSAYANGKSQNVNFIRYHDTTQSGTLIDKATYDKYVAIEEQWGVDFEVYEEVVDGVTRYRGAPSRSSSVDAFHVAGTTTGVNIVSTIVESMVDDGSNQHAASSRLHDYKINGDVVTLYFKDTATGVAWGNVTSGGTIGVSSCPEFSVGDIIYIYTPDGRVVCEAPVLSASVKTAEKIDVTISDPTKPYKVLANVHMVTIAAKDFHAEELINPNTGAQYNLADNRYNMDDKVTVDNLSRNACNYTLDNVMVRNSHSRGFLIKSRNVVVKHCTFRNVSINGLLIRSETEWAESTLAKDITIKQCLFDNVGFLHNGVNEKEQACIRIQGTSTVVSDATLPIDNITITGCKFTNNTQRVAIWVNSAKNVTISDNIFDDVIYNVAPKSKGTAVVLEVCMNVEISDNTYNYAHYDNDITNVIKGVTAYANIFGTDVTDENGNKIFADKLP